ncbi:MAG TPA: bifunctional demethylmenaquinone methyltransferase/2-methoxy-6-polyprenyl-1,4-benzoquinol methylase UbiE [Thermodesulfobacteriota bacterium]|jgi:demethylmenaquinone methyltransferase/2-methoxy-6-polyprenyl-1,4-benzoquinol methylase
MPNTRSIFNSVAENYDLLNTIFSLGRDKRWRERLAKEIEGTDYVLDIATGTGEVLIEILKNNNQRNAIGLDPSAQMLVLGQKKINCIGLNKKINFIRAVGESLPFRDDSFDAITIAFGIRNTVDPLKSLEEMNRVLKPTGKLGILEFAVPNNKIFGPIYMFYLKRVLPLVASVFNKREEYQYLGDSISKFPDRDNFIGLLKEAGFLLEKSIELMIGTVIIYIGIKKNRAFS